MAAEVPGAPAVPLQSLIDAAPLTALQIRVVLLCVLAFIAEGIDLNLVPLIAPSIAADWHVPAATFSAIFSSAPIGLIIGGFATGYLADRYGRRRALIGAMMLMTLSTLATAWTRNVPELLACRVLTGIGFGGIIPASTALVSEFLPTRSRTSAVAFVILGQSVGGLLAGLFMKTRFASADWQALILQAGTLCAAMTVLLMGLLPESPRYLLLQPGGARLEELLRRLRIRGKPLMRVEMAAIGRGRVGELFAPGRAVGTALLWVTFVGVCATISFFTSWLTLIFTYAGKTAAAGVSATSVYYLGGVIGGLVVPLFCVRWRVSLVLLTSILVGALCCVGLSIALHSADVITLAWTFGCGVFVPAAFYMLYPPVVGFYPTAMRSTGLGAAVAVGRIGNTVSPAAAGFMLSAGLLPATVFLVMAGPLVVAAVALAAFHRLTGGKDAHDAVQ